MYCCLNYCHIVCTIHDKDTKHTSCYPIHPGIHKDPSIGAQTLGLPTISNGCQASSWNSKLDILE